MRHSPVSGWGFRLKGRGHSQDKYIQGPACPTGIPLTPISNSLSWDFGSSPKMGVTVPARNWATAVVSCSVGSSACGETAEPLGRASGNGLFVSLFAASSV